MNIGILEQPLKTRQDDANIVVAGLNVDKHDRPSLFGPAINAIDHLVGHDHPVLAGLARLRLRHHRN